MILTLVDRLCDAGSDRAGFTGASWERLQRLAAGIGLADWPVNLVLVGDEAMANLNSQYRASPSVTDVLSFSYLAPTGPGPCDLARGEGRAAGDLWREVPLADGPAGGDAVGELVIAPCFVADRCRDRGWPLDLEIPWLVVHGCLHLVGWDHEEAAARQAMQNLEAELLAGEGFAHPLRKRS